MGKKGRTGQSDKNEVPLWTKTIIALVDAFEPYFTTLVANARFWGCVQYVLLALITLVIAPLVTLHSQLKRTT